MKKHTTNYIRVRLDYFLMNENSTDLVRKVEIGRICPLSYHKPIHLKLSLLKIQKVMGFWRLIGDLLVDPEFIFGWTSTFFRLLFCYD